MHFVPRFLQVIILKDVIRKTVEDEKYSLDLLESILLNAEADQAISCKFLQRINAEFVRSHIHTKVIVCDFVRPDSRMILCLLGFLLSWFR